jgi:hypothetical protein
MIGRSRRGKQRQYIVVVFRALDRLMRVCRSSPACLSDADVWAGRPCDLRGCNFAGMLRRLVAPPHPSRVAKHPSFNMSNPKTAALILRVAAVRAHQTRMGYPTRCRSWNDISSSSLIFTIMDCAARLRDIFTNTTYHNTPCLATRP